MVPTKENDRPTFIELEGLDNTGKNEAALETAFQLVDRGHNVVFTNYPQYWSPTGLAIRSMNRDGEAKNLLASLDPGREAQVRCAMFALDRAFTLSQVNYMQRAGGAVLVSDRGPDSNAVTLGYLVASGRVQQDWARSVLLGGLDGVDQEMRSLFNINPILCVNEAGSHALRDKLLDQYEAAKPQEESAGLYSLLGFPEVITKSPQGWRNIGDIAADIIGRFDGALSESNGEGKLLVNGPSQLINMLEIGYLFNQKQLIEWYKLAIETRFDKGKKQQLDLIESEIARGVADQADKIDFTFYERNPESMIAVSRLIVEYPEILSIIEMTCGEKFTTCLITLLGFNRIRNSLP